MYFATVINDVLAVSGQPPKIPVVSPKSGSIFEKELILRYIEQHHKDPISSENLSEDELIEIRTSPYQLPRQPNLNSVPSLLSALQNEWDSVALQLFQLTKQLDDTRKELSTALYHHDAAVRVAAKAIKERDEARRALENLALSISGEKPLPSNDEPSQIEDDQDQPVIDSNIPEDIVEEITNANNELFAIHKSSKQKVNVDIGYELQIQEQLTSAKPFKSVISTNVIADNKIYLTSSTGITSVFDIGSSTLGKDETIPKNKNITSILKINNNSIIGLLNGQILVNDSKIDSSISNNEKIIKLLSHPTLPIFVSFSSGGHYAIHTIEPELKTIYKNSLNDPISSADIHLDGALISVGSSNGKTYLIDLRTGELASTFQSTIEAQVDQLKFGNNGYWLFSSLFDGDKSIVEVWDLRKEKSSAIETQAQGTLVKIITDKSSNLILGLTSNSLELIQYDKSSKSWKYRGQYKITLNKGDKITDGVLINDKAENKLSVQIVTEHSSIEVINLE
ncbi:hypothetical protein WICMUC_003283 [Wickerhamomyces mucosus]|uniref:Pre-mRNA-processing factor 19 n=1 Tax=Wickerhamomyces mucosus TaxID=1378264 RepID=A0A9P8TCU3_9ASCO|nr:hypothetical protein WICMUC_003283 [Wickerhamomyces mucosus]